MKRIFVYLLLTVFTVSLSVSASAANPNKIQKKTAYVLKNLGISAAQQKSMAPLVTSYLTDLKEAKKKEKDLEDKYARDIEKKTLTDAAAQALLSAKWECDAKELEVKKNYAKRFAAVIPAKKVYLAFDLLNDKMSKIEGKKTSKSKNDEDDE